MSLTTIGQQKTPGRPIELTFDPETGLPSDSQELILVGAMGPTGGAASGSPTASGYATPYTPVSMSAVANLSAAEDEANLRFGEGSKLAEMVIAAVTAVQSGSVFPAIKCMPLPEGATDYGPSLEGLTGIENLKGEYIVGQFDANDTDTRADLEAHCELVSGAQRVENNQYGSIGVLANMSVSDPANLPSPDSQYLSLQWFRDSAPGDYDVHQVAAACAARLAANLAPFNPVDSVVIPGIPAPALESDYISVGAGLQSEAALDKGWTPIYVKPNGDVAFVRSVTTRITIDGTVEATAYYDVQDFNVLYLWRKTLKARWSQPDFTQTKASEDKAKLLLSEAIRLAQAFEDQDMFQRVSELAKQFQVERNATDRHRFDLLTPVNVIPGLHVIATRVAAGTQFDTISLGG